MHKYDKAIYFQISTYEILKNKTSEIIDILNNVVDLLRLNLGIDLMIEIDMNNGRDKMYKFNETNLKKIFDMIKKRNLLRLCIRDYAEDYYDDDPYVIENEEDEYLSPAFSLGITFDYREEVKYYLKSNEKVANGLDVRLSNRLFENSIPFYIQKNFVQLLKNCFMKLNGVTAFLTYETIGVGAVGFNTALEEAYYPTYSFSSQHFTECIRGYFWGNILTENHIKQLGGMECIKRKAPCLLIEELQFLDKKAVYLQLTEDINDYSDEQLRNLRDYLLPLFPKKGKLPPIYSPYSDELEKNQTGAVSRTFKEDMRQTTKVLPTS